MSKYLVVILLTTSTNHSWTISNFPLDPSNLTSKFTSKVISQDSMYSQAWSIYDTYQPELHHKCMHYIKICVYMLFEWILIVIILRERWHHLKWLQDGTFSLTWQTNYKDEAIDHLRASSIWCVFLLFFSFTLYFNLLNWRDFLSLKMNNLNQRPNLNFLYCNYWFNFFYF